jgi:hypothetical protein
MWLQLYIPGVGNGVDPPDQVDLLTKKRSRDKLYSIVKNNFYEKKDYCDG